MNTTSRPSRNTPLKETTNANQSRPMTGSRRAPACRRGLLVEDRLLVVQRLEPRRAQDRLAQPLQPEDQQQGADHQLEQRLREPLDEGVAGEQRHRRECHERRGGPGQRRAPVAGDPHGEHDRERLDELDGRRQCHGEQQAQLPDVQVSHGPPAYRVDPPPAASPVRRREERSRSRERAARLTGAYGSPARGTRAARVPGRSPGAGAARRQ